MTQSNPAHVELRSLLSERNQYPERAARIDAEIRRKFERKVAIFVLDMSGFSRLTARFGIIHYLAMIEQMDGAARPAIARNGGVVVKQEADNIFAYFPTPAAAVEGALDVLGAFAAMNTVLPDERDIHGCIGIGYGDTLVIGERDMFGNEMNLASKLGEDLATRGEILLTAAAHDALAEGVFAFESARFEAGGLDIEAWRFQKRLDEDLT